MPIFDLGPFRRQLRKKQDEFQEHLSKGFLPIQIAYERVTIEIMEDDLSKGEKELKKYTEPVTGESHDAGLRWWVAASKLAWYKVNPRSSSPRVYDTVKQSYKDLAARLRSNVKKVYTEIIDTDKVRQVSYIRHNLQTQLAIERIASALMDYYDYHENDEDFLRYPAEVGLNKMLEEDRLDLGITLRLALSLGKDIDDFVLETKERPTWTTAVELIISFIPIIGNTVAAYEAYRGKDLFGYELSDIERGILAAAVLLPAAARLVKSGRALYTSSRMVALYGKDAASWSYSMALGERLSGDAIGMLRLKTVDEAVADGKRILRSDAEKITELLKSLGLDSKSAVVKPIEIEAQAVKFFEQIAAKNSKLAGLDALAIERIAAKGANVDHVKGQILEELLETQIAKWLSDPYGRTALGLGQVKGTLHFIPGHLIRDEFGLQLTDGMIVQWAKERLRIVAVFEAKSGKSSAMKLAKGISKLTDKEKALHLAEATSGLKELQERARIANLPPPTITLEDLMKEIKRTEAGGQIRSDLERLSELKLWINGREVNAELLVGPRSTRWIGIVPKDVAATEIKRGIQEAFGEKYGKLAKIDVMGLDVSQNELIKAAKDIVNAVIKEIASK